MEVCMRMLISNILYFAKIFKWLRTILCAVTLHIHCLSDFLLFGLVNCSNVNKINKQFLKTFNFCLAGWERTITKNARMSELNLSSIMNALSKLCFFFFLHIAIMIYVWMKNSLFWYTVAFFIALVDILVETYF